MFHQGHRPLNTLFTGGWRRYHLYQRNQVGRVDRMCHEAALRVLQVIGKARGGDPRGGAGQHAVTADHRLQIAVDLTFRGHVFRPALLDVDGVLHGRDEVAVKTNSGHDRHWIIDQPSVSQVRQRLLDRCRCPVQGICIYIKQGDGQLCSSEDDGPGATNESCADHTDGSRHESVLRSEGFDVGTDTERLPRDVGSAWCSEEQRHGGDIRRVYHAAHRYL